jgi:plasmid stabilization system protein ParE
MVPEYEMDRLRELIVQGYRVIYSLDDPNESVRIHAIQHGRRDLRRRLGDYPETEA